MGFKEKLITKLITFFSSNPSFACPICRYYSSKEFEDSTYLLCGNCGYTFEENQAQEIIITTNSKFITKLCFRLGYDNAYHEKINKKD